MSCLYCLKPVLARQMCSAHYNRWRTHGDPHMVTLAPRGASLAFLRGLVNHDDDECVPWPFKAQYRNGYGSVWFEGRLTGAHRAMCRLAHGDPNGREAAHSCGTRLCVNPKHLRWATAQENARDKSTHGTNNAGTKNPQAKLDEGQVRAIRAMVGRGQSHSAIAAEFAISRRNVSSIASGATWKES